jgi:hypothetical protein
VNLAAEPTLATVLAELRLLAEAVARIEAALGERATDAEVRLVNELAGYAKPGERFSAGDVIGFAEVDVGLRQALAPVVGSGQGMGLRLGKAFQRLQRFPVGEYRLRRAGERGGSALWEFWKGE